MIKKITQKGNIIRRLTKEEAQDILKSGGSIIVKEDTKSYFSFICWHQDDKYRGFEVSDSSSLRNLFKDTPIGELTKETALHMLSSAGKLKFVDELKGWWGWFAGDIRNEFGQVTNNEVQYFILGTRIASPLDLKIQ